MKAVPVLLCLALAHGITARIFKFEDPQVDNLEQQQEHIDHYQVRHRNQPSEFEKLHNYQPGQQFTEQRTYQQRDQERDQTRPQQGDQQSNQERYQRPGIQAHDIARDQIGEQNYREQIGKVLSEQNFEHMKYQPSSAQQYQDQDKEQNPNQLHHSHHNQRPHGHLGHSSDESSHSSHSSQESQERRQYNDHIKPSIDIRQRVPQDVAVTEENQMITYGDNIDRYVGRMAAGPSVLVHNKEEIKKIFGDAQAAMRHVTDEEKVQFHQSYQLAKQQNIENVVLNATQLAQKHQYLVEEHIIKTDDGYQLTLFRIPSKKQIRDVQKRPVVFLMHGIDGSADDWLLMGPQKSLAYLLADAGYDVWLGNARGNKYSRHHVSKHPAVADFWQYSIDEIALHDLPAMIDYALETTKQEKLYYIGYSQGTTAFFALTATRPEYNNKIIMMYALSPIVYMNNVRSPLFRMISPLSMFYNRIQQLFGNGPFNPNKELIQTVGGAMLEKATGCKWLSSNINFVMAGVNLDGLDPALIAIVMNHLPSGTSTKVIKQYGQAVASHEFRKFDYGPKTNEKVYGKVQPPKYEMQKVQAPVTIYYSEEDWLAHPKDVERLVRELPNVKEAHKVPEQHFSHLDFQFSPMAPEMVYTRLIESMQNNQ